METMNFNEVQRFKTRWAWLVVIAFNGLFMYAIFQQLIIGKAFGPKPAPGYILIIAELCCLLFLFVLVSIKLKTKINNTGIYYRFYPFQFKETVIEWHELRDVYIRQYHSFHEYGGWGIRKGNENAGNAINTSASSNKGLQLQFNDGKFLLLGTAKPDEMEVVIEAVINSGKINRRV